MSKKLMSVAINRSTRELIGYWISPKGIPIVVKAYAVDDLEKKFKKAVVNHAKLEERIAWLEKKPIVFPDNEMFSGTMGG